MEPLKQSSEENLKIYTQIIIFSLLDYYYD